MDALPRCTGEHRVPVHVEVRCDRTRSPDETANFRERVHLFVAQLPIVEEGLLDISGSGLEEDVWHVRICDFSDSQRKHGHDGQETKEVKYNDHQSVLCQIGRWRTTLPFWQVKPVLHVYSCNHSRAQRSLSQNIEQNPELDNLEFDNSSRATDSFVSGQREDDFRLGAKAAFHGVTELPDESLEGLWENLFLDSDIKSYLLEYISTGCLFSKRAVDPNLVAWNRLALLYGPPGSGKTTLGRALANKLSIRLDCDTAKLLEVHANSLFSKWFSESSRNVAALFADIHRLAASCDLLVVLIDEVESLSASRAGGAATSEPGDALRVVNTLLTALDELRRLPNVLVIATSNLTDQIDAAFLDRADLSQYIGLPSLDARYEILRAGVNELICRGIVTALSTEDGPEYRESGPRRSPTEDRKAGLLPPSASLMALDMLCTHEGFEPSPRRTCELLLAEAARASAGLSGRTLRKLCLLAHAGFISHSEEAALLPVFLRAMQRAALAENETRRRVASTSSARRPVHRGTDA